MTRKEKEMDTPSSWDWCWSFLLPAGCASPASVWLSLSSGASNVFIQPGGEWTSALRRLPRQQELLFPVCTPSRRTSNVLLMGSAGTTGSVIRSYRTSLKTSHIKKIFYKLNEVTLHDSGPFKFILWDGEDQHPVLPLDSFSYSLLSCMSSFSSLCLILCTYIQCCGYILFVNCLISSISPIQLEKSRECLIIWKSLLLH